MKTDCKYKKFEAKILQHSILSNYRLKDDK